jgi:hypothetical protein
MNDHSLGNPSLTRAMTGVIEQQLRDGNPPETRQTFDRLRDAGYPQRTAVGMIGEVLINEIDHMMPEKRAFDRDRFQTLLQRLEEKNCPIVDKVST